MRCPFVCWLNRAPSVRQAAPSRNASLHKIWTRHAVLPGIRAGNHIKNIWECLGVNLRTVHRFGKEFGESNGDYEGMAARKTHSSRSNKKIIHEFVGEIKTMTDSDSSMSMKAIAMDTGVSEFMQTVHEDLRYFSYKMRKGQQDYAPCHTSKRTLA